jgi:LysM domain-containing protein/uncharacterized protein DUF5715
MRLLSAFLLVFGTLPLVAPRAAAQSLRGSSASVDLMYERAQENDLSFYRTPSEVRAAVDEGVLVAVPVDNDVAVARGVKHPYVLPTTREWLMGFAERYHTRCGNALVVTSGARSIAEQPRNGSTKSVHPTGMAIDLRRPTGSCLRWLRTALLDEERAGLVEATEERHPRHFHVAVFPNMPAVAVRIASRPTPKPEFERYRVRPGDTLWEIAKRRDTTVHALKSINKLRSAQLVPGQTLLVPVD